MFAEPSACLPKVSGRVQVMDRQHIERLGRYVAARRTELGLSQEDVAAADGPSTTTLSKIENGTARSINRRTARALERALGWRHETLDYVLYGDGDFEPVVERRATDVPDGRRPLADYGEEGDWASTTVSLDAQGRVVHEGKSVSTDRSGVVSVLEIRYKPGDRRVIRAIDFVSVLGAAHNQAMKVTVVDRSQTREEVGSHGDSAPTSEAGATPVEDPMSDPDGYVLAARDVDDDEEVEAQQQEP